MKVSWANLCTWLFKFPVKRTIFFSMLNFRQQDSTSAAISAAVTVSCVETNRRGTSEKVCIYPIQFRKKISVLNIIKPGYKYSVISGNNKFVKDTIAFFCRAGSFIYFLEIIYNFVAFYIFICLVYSILQRLNKWCIWTIQQYTNFFTFDRCDAIRLGVKSYSLAKFSILFLLESLSFEFGLNARLTDDGVTPNSSANV